MMSFRESGLARVEQNWFVVNILHYLRDNQQYIVYYWRYCQLITNILYTKPGYIVNFTSIFACKHTLQAFCLVVRYRTSNLPYMVNYCIGFSIHPPRF